MKLSDFQDEDYLSRKLDQQAMSRQRICWYLSGSAQDKHGRMKPFLLGPYPSAERAKEIANTKRLVNYEVLSLSTSNLATANQIIRARRLHGKENFADIFERVSHKRVGLD